MPRVDPVAGARVGAAHRKEQVDIGPAGIGLPDIETVVAKDTGLEKGADIDLAAVVDIVPAAGIGLGVGIGPDPARSAAAAQAGIGQAADIAAAYPARRRRRSRQRIKARRRRWF